jgi:hypothetical protein
MFFEMAYNGLNGGTSNSRLICGVTRRFWSLV